MCHRKIDRHSETDPEARHSFTLIPSVLHLEALTPAVCISSTVSLFLKGLAPCEKMLGDFGGDGLGVIPKTNTQRFAFRQTTHTYTQMLTTAVALVVHIP